MMQGFLTVMWAMLLAVLLAVSGCAPLLTAKEAHNMTPEQIKAYAEQGLDVYQCLNIAGPPPAGGFTFVMVPKGAKFEVAFGSNCSLLVGRVAP